MPESESGVIFAPASIVIPCYNAESWVAQAIESALGQTYPNVEVVVVDDGSTDSSLQVIERFKERIRYVTGPNRGPSAARNRGLQLARGEWIQFLDADDLLHPEKLALSFSSLAVAPKADFIWAPNLKFSGATPAMPFYGTLEAAQVSVSRRALDAIYAPSAAVFNRRFLDAVGAWDELLTRWVDLEYHARIAARMSTLIRIDVPLYFYRQHGGTQISAADRAYADVERALQALVATRRAFEGSTIPDRDWKSVLFPFYIHLSRSAAKRGDAKTFCALLREAAMLRGSRWFHVKRWLATFSVHLFGIRWTSAMVDLALRRREPR
jgi:glycosyltransferase involved in cell wall biosynthesis